LEQAEGLALVERKMNVPLETIRETKSWEDRFSLSTPRPRRHADRAEWRKRQLKIATIRCVAAGGIERATFDEVTSLAKVSRGLIRYYFDSKAQLVSESWRFLCEDFQERVMRSVTPESEAPLAELLTLIEMSYSLNAADKSGVAAWFVFWNAARTDRELKQIYDEFYSWYEGLIVNLFERLAREHAPIMPHEEAALGLIAMADGFWFKEAIDGDRYAPAKTTKICLAYVKMVFPTADLDIGGSAPTL